MVPKLIVVVAACLGLTGVAMGAFAAHALQDRLDEHGLRTIETAVRYQMYHALALLAVAWIHSICGTAWTRSAAWCFVVGVVLFSGSLYGLALAGWSWLGPVTPIGGSLMMLGWLLLGVAGLRSFGAMRTGHDERRIAD